MDTRILFHRYVTWLTQKTPLVIFGSGSEPKISVSFVSNFKRDNGLTLTHEQFSNLEDYNLWLHSQKAPIHFGEGGDAEKCFSSAAIFLARHKGVRQPRGTEPGTFAPVAN